MGKVLTAIFIISLMISISFAGGKKYGKDITLKEKTKISLILKNPKNYVGKKVLVEGPFVNVCEKRGCWIDLGSDNQYGKIKVI